MEQPNATSNPISHVVVDIDQLQATTDAASTAGGGDDGDGGAESSCAVCTEPLEWVAIGPCGHRVVCSSCMVRIRFVYKDTLCCLCRTPCPKVVVVRGDCADDGADVLAGLLSSAATKSRRRVMKAPQLHKLGSSIGRTNSQ
uniref:RING-type domain-containing protein n=1 Tax=Oryza punctata TaxID=4537 RepID=A0A0E0LNK3_ORYPU